MKKNLKYFLIFCFAFLLFYNNAYALENIICTGSSYLNIRKEPTSASTALSNLSKYEKAELLSTTLTEGSGCSAGWYNIKNSDGIRGYVCSSYVTIESSYIINNQDYYTTKAWGFRVNNHYSSVRTGPGTQYKYIESLYLGTPIEVISETTTPTSGCKTGWYKMNYYNNKTGYICKDLVDSYEDVATTNTDYNKTLQDAGFPESYWPFLSKLHEKHPNWIFKVSNTNKDFETAIENELHKNYIQSNQDSYVISHTIVEPTSWKEASSAMVAFFLDTRNYLSDKAIFAFEELSYDETNHTRNIVSSIFGTSSYLTNNNDDIDYIQYFMDAAESYDVSPVHLASRVKQEGGADSTYAAITGTITDTWDGKSLKGYYNYYNIGAYSSSSNPLLRGVATAAGYTSTSSGLDGIPWDTREKAIKYGAKFIADDYINKGQNTMYYQKFNTGPNTYFSSYSHQYMANITAPLSESKSTYNTYNELLLLEKAYTFAIPIYNNMPEDLTSHPKTGDTNTELSTIKIDDQTINGFDKDVITYTHYISNELTSVNIKTETVSSYSTVSGDGTIQTPNDKTTVNIKVTSETGTSKTYTIELIKKENPVNISINEIVNKIDVKVTSNYLSGIYANTTASGLANSFNKQSPNTNIKITNNNGTEKTGALITGDLITITTPSESKTYTIVLKGDINKDGKVDIKDLLKVQKHLLKTYTLSGSAGSAADTDYNSKIDLRDLLRVQKHILGSIKLK